MNKEEMIKIHGDAMERAILSATGKSSDQLTKEANGGVEINGTLWILVPESVLTATRLGTLSVIDAVYKENGLEVPDFITNELAEAFPDGE